VKQKCANVVVSILSGWKVRLEKIVLFEHVGVIVIVLVGRAVLYGEQG
jgi:hypothetical protein